MTSFRKLLIITGSMIMTAVGLSIKLDTGLFWDETWQTIYATIGLGLLLSGLIKITEKETVSATINRFLEKYLSDDVFSRESKEKV